jgi:uncharacterized membrane protein
MNRPSWTWPVIIIISAVSSGLLVFGDFLPSARYLLSFWFLLVCPGMAYVRLLHIRDSVTEWALAIALSLAIDTVVAMFMLYTGNWSPNGGLVALMAISIGGVALQLKDMRLTKGASSMHQGEDL